MKKITIENEDEVENIDLGVFINGFVIKANILNNQTEDAEGEENV